MDQQAGKPAAALSAVSVLGLGPMGQALAGAFVKAGHRTTVWNRTPARADALVARGAARATTAADAVAASPLVIACLLDDGAVHATLDPVAEVLKGRALVNLTSTSPEQARTMAAWATDLGVDYLDGAIMTPTPTIGQPTALVLYSGPENLYHAHRPTLASLGAAATYLGSDPGRAAAHDVALLDVFWTSVCGIVHGLALARAEGISGSELTPYAQPIFGLLPEMIARFARQFDNGHYPGDRSTIASGAAAIEHIIHTAQAHHIDAGVLTASKTIIQRAIDAGHGTDGLSRLAEVLTKPTPAE